MEQKDTLLNIAEISSMDFYIEDVEESNYEVAGTWASAGTFASSVGGCASTAGTASSFG